MSSIGTIPLQEPSLNDLRRLRRVQAWTLSVVSVASIVSGVVLARLAGEDATAVFLRTVGWQFVIWGAIDLIFGLMGVTQSVRADRRPPSVQAAADEFLSAEKLLKTLRFNHKLNVGYVVLAAALLAWAALAQSPGLAGHGAGVLIQGGFLLVLDAAFASRLAKLMTSE